MSSILAADLIGGTVYALLHREIGADSCAEFDLASLARAADCAPSTVRKALNRLAAAGLIDIVDQGCRQRVCLGRAILSGPGAPDVRSAA